MIRLRFVAGIDTISLAIIARSQVCMPFTPSHVECVRPDGKYIGQHFSGGMQARDPGYDKSYLGKELFVDIEASDAQTEAFYDYMNSQIGSPYDWRAILDFLLPIDAHVFAHSICSAVVSLGLRKASVYRWPLAVPTHLISPRDVLMTLSAMQEIKH